MPAEPILRVTLRAFCSPLPCNMHGPGVRRGRLPSNVAQVDTLQSSLWENAMSSPTVVFPVGENEVFL